MSICYVFYSELLKLGFEGVVIILVMILESVKSTDHKLLLLIPIISIPLPVYLLPIRKISVF